MKNLKLYIHPLYFALALFNIVIGRGVIFVAFFAATVLHELAHAYVAAKLGYSMQRISMMPYGAVVSRLECLPHKPAVKIALAGPFANCTIALVVVAMWWITPDIYSFTIDFLRANIWLAIVNMLPCYPLDGSRICIGCCKKKLRTIMLCKWASVAVGLAMIALGVASIWYEFNVSLMVMGGYLIVSAGMGSEREAYEHITSSLPWVKDYARGVEKRDVYLDIGATLMQVLRQLSQSKIIDFYIVNRGEVVAILSEPQLKNYLENYPLPTKLHKIVNIQKNE